MTKRPPFRRQWNSTLPARKQKISQAQGKRAGIRRKKIKAVNPSRREKSFARCYGSRARVAWVKSQPCAWCVLRGLVRISRPSDNAHSEGGGGMGRKADYTTVLPMCRRHHEQYDQHRAPFDRPIPRAAIKILAERTEAAWQERCAMLTVGNGTSIR
jgi:hypothetical protein